MPPFPFTAIVGQDEMKLCLLLNVIDPRIGGVMVMGHRGTGKSTTVRALADVLPEIKRVVGDVYNRSVEEVERLEIKDWRLELQNLQSPISNLQISRAKRLLCRLLICRWAQPKTACAGRLILRRR